MANICCICLESVLSGGAVGATSCGHCFHTECFVPWQSRGGGFGRNDVKCPTCNTNVKLFHPLYLDFGAVLQLEAGDEDDDETIDSDIEEEEEEAGAMATARAGENRKRTEKPTEIIIPIDDEIAVVEMISPAIKKQPESLAKYKQKLAKYKANAKRQGQTIESLQKYVEELKKSDQDQHRIIEELNSRMGTKEKEVERLVCENHVIGRRSELTEVHLKSTQQQLAVAIGNKEQIEHQLQMLQHQQRKESSKSMTEVRRCMEERPKLLEQIKSLKAQLARSTLAAAPPPPKQIGTVSKQRQLLHQLDLECQERKQVFAFPAPPSPRNKNKYSKRANDMMQQKSWKAPINNNPLVRLSALRQKTTSSTTR